MKSSKSISTWAMAVGLGAVLAGGAHAQSWTSAYTSATATGDCSALPGALNTGFATTPIVSQALFAEVKPFRVLKMDFWLQPGAQYNDIYMIEKGTSGSARVLYYNGVDKSLKVIGTLTVAHGTGGVNEQGLLGIALNPVSFGTDHYLYLFYSVGSSPTNAHSGDENTGWRVVRYTLDPSTRMMDMASAKVLLHIPAGMNARWHTAGAMKFDNFGNLYITAADNEALANGPGNTADLRGGILRIKPDNSEKGYSIPAGNFGDYWAQKWQDSGLTARAAEYRDAAKVRPEIYVKGSRNPYSLSVDRHRLGWLAWGECGPDQQRGEEHNFTTKPAFSGWPFWAGNGTRQQSFASSYNEPNEPNTTALWTAFNFTGMSTDVPINNWTGNTGVDTLPPMHVPSQAYTSPSCAVGGDPIIRYDGSVSNPKKMPPHLDNVMMTADFGVTNTNSIWAMKIDTLTGKTIGTPTQVFTMAKTGRPNTSNMVDFQHGRDGSMYAIDWGTGCCNENSSATNNGIIRIDYTGTCQDPGLVPPAPTSIAQTVHRGSVDWLRVRADAISVNADGMHSVKVMDINGRLIKSYNGVGKQEYAMPQGLSAGTLYVLRVETNLGIAVRTFSRF